MALISVGLLSIITILGGHWVVRRVGQTSLPVLPFLISASTGILLALILTEFLPHSLLNSTPWTPLYIFFGFFVVVGAEKHIGPRLWKSSLDSCEHDSHTLSHDGHQHHDHHHHKSDFPMVTKHAACSSIGCIVVCAFFDGLQIPVAFAIDAKTGWLVVLGLASHAVPQGALAASMGLAGGLSPEGAKRGALIVGVAFFAGALVSHFVTGVLVFQKTVLPFATGVLLYVCFSHLMPVALKSKYGLMALTLGAVLIWALGYGHFATHFHGH